MTNDIRLTQFSHGSGCGCKIAPAILEEILRDSGVQQPDTHLLVGYETRDDAAVYDLGNGTALISTVDFFTPIVDNPFDYGRIAACNALSDVYAMGGKPMLAIAILGYPTEQLPPEIARQIIAGGKETCRLAGIPLAGGHTIDSKEPFFGLAVNGIVDVQHLKKNATARSGDLIYLTKPLGTGMLATALKRGVYQPEQIQHAVDSMCLLNTLGSRLGTFAWVHAMTDVTGYALLGHLMEMCEGSGLSARLYYPDVPMLHLVKECCAAFVYADNTMRNWKSFEGKVQGVSGESLLTLCDPQTSGGLMISIAPQNEGDFLQVCNEENVRPVLIGEMISRESFVIDILNRTRNADGK